MRPQTLTTSFLAVALLIAASTLAAAQANPFLKGSAEDSAPADGLPVARGRVLAWLSDAQRSLNDSIATLSRQAKEDPSAAPVFLAFLTAFLIGMVHAAGPGHGKTFTLSYFLAENPRVSRGLLFGGLISILDSVSSIAIVAGSYLVFRVALPAHAADSATGLLQKVSYALIVAIGIWHFVTHLRPHRHHHCGHDHAEGPDHAPRRGLWPLAISIGLVPCPIEIMLLVFGLSIGAFGFGVVLTLFVSLGQAAALALVAIAAMALRSSALAVAGAAARARVTRVLEVGGSALIVVFGVVLLVSVM